jgi:hypothetical protein
MIDPGADARKDKLQYRYLTDADGKIIETRPVDPYDHVGGKTLGGMGKPKTPDHIDTPEKKAVWDKYWEGIIGWWDAEQRQEFRDRTWR